MVRIPALVLATLGLTLTAGASSAATVRAAGEYQVIDLGTLGGESSYATAINDRGEVAGASAIALNDNTYHGFLWRNGAMIDLGLFDPVDINNKGQIIGRLGDEYHAYLWDAGTLTDLGTLGGLFSSAVAINDRGEVVGMSDTADGQEAAFLWSKGHMRRLPLNAVTDINNRGQVTGSRPHGEGYHAAVWYRGRVTDLGAGPFDRGGATGINERGWVIGLFFSPEYHERGMLWRNGTVTDVGTLGGTFTHLQTINNRGQILGISQIPDGNTHPVLWQHGVLTDLSTAGVSAESDVRDLNNRGDIAGSIRIVWGVGHAVIYRR
ncbi:MAG TPA: hypothetical protein VFU43_03560 [Streptosporangiaceae bacterium]|nr:hypothetical protein [Streptosporangiaceae bacterium]